MPVVTIDNYVTSDNPNPLPRSLSRQCPTFRLPWSSIAVSYTFTGATPTQKQRRIAFIAIQLVSLVSLIRAWWSSPHRSFLQSLPWLLTDVLFFFFVVWNLHLIVSCEGERTVFGRRFGTHSFSGFLWGVLAAKVVLLGLGWGLGWAVATGGVCLGLAIFGVAWVSTWDEDKEGVLLG